MMNLENVAVVIATFRRPVELRRLLKGLASGSLRPALVVIVDNAAGHETVGIAEDSGLEVEVIALPENPGCGAAWKRGMEFAMEREEISHFWILDDDVVIPSDALDLLLTGMREADALVGAPLLEDDQGNLWAFPEPEEPALRKTIREVKTPVECLAALGAGPHAFCWCTGACVLVSRKAVEKTGFHRTDFHILGEDLEYSMRLSASCRCMFFPAVVVPHLPPPPKDARAAERSGRIKFLSLLQNLTYLSVHSPDSRHMWKYLPGNYRRYVKTHGWRGLPEMLICAVAGLVGQPAGGNMGQWLRERVR